MRTNIANPYGSKRERERESILLSANNSVAIVICDGKNIRVRYE